MSRAVGIDLGTTNSVVAVFEGGEPTVVANAEGHRTTPSVVAFSKGGEVLVGEVAKRQAITNPDRTVRSVKRNMGTDWSIKIDDKEYNSQEISARILQKLKRDAESYLGTEVTQAVITVPAYFGDAQRQATKEAGQIAGLEVLRIINEPTAAALAYGLDKEAHDQTILVYDLGGGTFDVSVMEIGEGVFEVKSTSGNTSLGGDDFDQRVIDWMVTQFKNDHGVDLSSDAMALQRLKEAAEKAKIELSQVTETEINLPFVTATAEGPLHLLMSLSRAKFQDLTGDLVEATRAPFLAAIKDAGINVSDIDHIIMVGGSTRMPAVQELIQELAGKEPHKGVNPDEVVAAGAALQAGVLKGAEVFTTAADGQPEVEVHVLQGERDMASDNKSLGKFNLTGIPPAPRGVPQIEVTFDIDANGIVSVSAKDLGTGKQQQITITGGTALPKDEIKQMVEDAETYATDDKERREKAEARNQADHLVYQTAKMLDEYGDKLSDEERAAIDEKVDELKKALEDQDASADRLRTATDAVLNASQVLGQKVYEESQAAAEAGEETGSDDDVVEAEIVDEGEES